MLNDIYKKKAKPLERKWKKLLEGINDPNLRAQTALLLENTWQTAMDYEKSKNPLLLMENTTYSANIAKAPKIVVPMVRRVLPELLANKVVGVEPMEGPVGLAFALRWVYDSDWGTISAGDEMFVPKGAEPETKYSGDATGAGYELSAGEVLGESGQDEIREASLKVTSVEIKARTRKLAATWSPESIDDLKKVHSIDIEKEIVNALSYEIQAEIDREIIKNINTLATSNRAISVSYNDLDGRWEAEKFKVIFHKIVELVNYVGYTSRRGTATWIITTPRVISALAAAKVFDEGSYQPLKGMEATYTQGSNEAGTILQGRVKVYVDIYHSIGGASEDYVLVGYKGKEFWDAGIIYCPYVPVMMMEAVDPKTFQPRIMFGTRYALVTSLLDTEKYYAKLTITDLPFGGY